MPQYNFINKIIGRTIFKRILLLLVVYSLANRLSAQCTGEPTAGNITFTSTQLCPGTEATFTLSGASAGNGISYQWQSSTDGNTWSNIANATDATYNFTPLSGFTGLMLRVAVTCSGSNKTVNTDAIKLAPPMVATYQALPFKEDFEAGWAHICADGQLPAATHNGLAWNNLPVTGNSSWRRQDDDAFAWDQPDFGAYAEPGADGSGHSARFHSTYGSTGILDLYLNCSGGTSVTKKLTFNYINPNGTDSMEVMLSTDGGSTFNYLRGAYTAATWKASFIFFNSTSPTTIIRFIAKADNNDSDMGLDEVSVDYADACTGKPVIGNVIASDNNVCSSTRFTLSLGTAAPNSKSAVIYQWQSSTDNASWADIPDATDPTYTGSATITTYFRVNVTCVTSGQRSLSNSVTVTNISSALTGAYTINSAVATGNKNFASFTDAARALRCSGVSGAVTFDVQAGSGPYHEQLIIDTVIGSSATNTIVFNGNGNIIQFGSQDANELAVVKLRGASHLAFNNLIIDGRSANNAGIGVGVHLLNNADSNTFRTCRILADTTGNPSSYQYAVLINGADKGISSSDAAACDSNYFDNNTIIGGYHAICMQNNPSGTLADNVFTHNVISNYFYKGIEIYGATNTLIDSNEFKCPVRRSSAAFMGVNLLGACSNTIISRNTFTNPTDGVNENNNLTYYGVFDMGDPDANDNGTTIVNNLLHDIGMGAYVYGISLSNTSANVYHNTIDINYAFTGNTGAINGIRVIDNIYGQNIENNLVTIHNNGSVNGYGIASLQWSINADRNNYYLAGSGNNFVGFADGADRKTIDDWKNATYAEGNSISVDPVYENPAAGNFVPTSRSFDKKGTPVGVPADIRNMLRSDSKPDIGCYEFSTCKPLHGMYTIDYSAAPGTARTFVSFTEANDALNCGIDSAVIFYVAPSSHVYNEQLNMEKIDGASDVNTVTFKGNGDTLRFSSTSSVKKAVVQFKGTSHVRIDSLVIDASAPDEDYQNRYGYGVQLYNMASNNVVHACTIISDTVKAHNVYPSQYCGVALWGSDFSDAVATDHNTFSNNSIIGGWCGVIMNGKGVADSFINNEVTRYSLYGMTMGNGMAWDPSDYIDSLVIEGNSIHNPILGAVAIGISKINNLVISKNRIYDMSSYQNVAILLEDISGAPESKSLIANNLIYNLGLDSTFIVSYIEGIECHSKGNISITHNTISLHNPHNAVNNIQTPTLLFGIETDYNGPESGTTIVKDNIVKIDGNGNSVSSCIRITDGPDGVFQNPGTRADYNNYVVDSAVNAVGAYNNTYAKSLADWRALVKLDSSSVSIEPMFKEAATGNYKPTNLKMDNLGRPVGVKDDILDVERSLTKPDMGCYEFDVCPANFAWFRTSDVNPCINAKVVLTAVNALPDGRPVTNWKWDLGNNTASADNTTSASYTAAGSYTVKLTASTEDGCTDDTTQTINVTDCDKELFIPNAFTPNNDGLNDVLQAYGHGISGVDFKVFNQWGQLLYTSADPSKLWDGTQNGRLQPSGAYVYVCQLTMSDGKKVVKKGAINLIR